MGLGNLRYKVSEYLRVFIYAPARTRCGYETRDGPRNFYRSTTKVLCIHTYLLRDVVKLTEIKLKCFKDTLDKN